MVRRNSSESSSGSISRKRRWQNVVAQRNYRIRQKERRKILERLALVALVPQVPLEVPSNYNDRLSHTHGLITTQNTEKPCISTGIHRLTTADVFSCISSCTELERHNFFMIMTREVFGIRDIIKYGLISLGHSVSPSLYDSAERLPMREWMESVESSLGGVDLLKEAFAAGISVLGRLKVTSERSISIHDMLNTTACPNPVDLAKSSITISRVSFLAAVLANALHLGIPWHHLLSWKAESHFPLIGKQLSREDDHLQQDTSRTSQIRRRAPDCFSSIKNDLIPTDIQLKFPHHPTLDAIPWPNFRSKVIVAMYSEPPLIDKSDFCLDLLNDGLRCWGSSGGDGHGQGAPWDHRSWEAAPWFLQKWENLTDGRDGDMWKTSAWWHSMQHGTGI
ncbi:hypothetical protein F4779DRAFT_611203 [Xylariaceae sp. FL0662B]|nr:hypothetical protein F4779DRAFT_611203 [Xylariaceae sp. FL0662B]